MRLLIKQRVFSWSDTYDVYDEDGNAKYFVKAEFLSLGHRLHVYDQMDREVGLIKEKLLTFLPVFEIEVNGVQQGLSRGFPYLSQNMKLILMDGGWRGISSDGIMMCIPAAVQ